MKINFKKKDIAKKLSDKRTKREESKLIPFKVGLWKVYWATASALAALFAGVKFAGVV